MAFVNRSVTLISTSNSTTTALSAGGTFIGQPEEVDQFASISVTLGASPSATATGTLYLEFSSDGTTWGSQPGAQSLSIDITSDNIVGYKTSHIPVMEYFRIRYVNGPVAQTEFNIQTIYSTQPRISISTSRVEETYNDQIDVINTRTAIVGKDFSNVYRNARVTTRIPDPSDVGLVVRPISPISQFNESVATERTPLIELNSAFGISKIRDVIITTGTGRVSATNRGEIVISTGSNANSYAALQSAEYGRYMPGYSAEVGMGIRIPTQNVNNNHVIKWGGFTSADGTFFGVSGNTPFVGLRRAGVNTFVHQQDWNIDKLDGTGPSSEILQLSAGNIFQIDFSWYGYGTIQYNVITNVRGFQVTVPVHSIRVNGNTSIADPNLPITVETINNSSASPVSAFVGGRQYSIIGKYLPSFRYTSQFKGSISTSPTRQPVIVFRRKEDYQNRTIVIDGYELIASTSDVILEVVIGGTINSTAFNTPSYHTPSETAVEVCTAASTIQGGTVVYSQLFRGGNNQNQETLYRSDSIGGDIPRTVPSANAIVALVIRTTSGNGNASVNFRIREEW